jgi:hypothetical protein
VKFLKGLIIFVAIILVAAVLVLGYMGFVPGVSDILGSNKPRDLGVAFTPGDFQSARAKTGTVIADLPSDAAPAQSIKFTGTTKTVNATFTQAEFNALLNKSWKYYPVSDCQLKVNADGTQELSGILHVDRLQGCAQALGFSDQDLKQVTDYLKAVPGNPPCYLKGHISIVNNQFVNSDITDLQIGKVPIPADQIQSNKNAIASAAQSVIAHVQGLSVKSFNFVNGQVKFDGTLPDYARAKE